MSNPLWPYYRLYIDVCQFYENCCENKFPNFSIATRFKETKTKKSLEVLLH